MVIHESNYFVETKSDNPYFKGIAFIVAAVFLALPLVFFGVCAFLETKGLVYLNEEDTIRILCFYAAFLFLAIPIAVVAPNFRRLGKTEKITGKVTDYVARRRQSSKSSGSTGISPVIEYEYNGKTFQKSLPFMRKKIEVGENIEIRMDRRNPEKIITEQQYNLFLILVILSIFSPYIFLIVLIIRGAANLFQGRAVFIPKKHCEKITARVIELLDNQQEYASVVEYNYNGRDYTKQLASWSTLRPFVGSTVKLRINPQQPEKIASFGELIFSIFAVVIFSIGSIIFLVLGIKAPSSNMEVTYNPSAYSSDNHIGLIIWIGFILVFLLIGIIYCIWVKNRSGNQTLMENGIRKYCQIIEVDAKTNVEVNGQNPVKIVCSVEGETITIKRNLFWRNQYKVGDGIYVYFDPDNEKRFYADLK